MNINRINILFMALLISPVISFGQTAPNTLSPEEELAGYDLLFNGENLDDWHGYRDVPINDKWNVYEDEPLGPRFGVGPGGWEPILTNNTYQNMDLKIEYSMAPGSNSGIFVRYEEEATSAWNTRSGPEFQLCSVGDQDCVNPIHMPGSAYDLFPVEEGLRDDWWHKDETWNEVRIINFDSNYVHYGNGAKILEYKIGTAEFIAAYNRSKYASDGNDGNYYDIHPGSILLQNHGEQVLVHFRNIKAKALTVHPFLQEFPDGQWPEEMSVDYVFGKRGCTDSEADNYDETAEVDDGTCETIVGILADKHPSLRVTPVKINESEFEINIPIEHADFKVANIMGKNVSFTKSGKNIYVIKTLMTNGVHIIRFNVNGVPVKRLVHLH